MIVLVLMCICMQAHYRDHGKMTYARSVLTIHNMAYQGCGPFDELDNFEIPDNYRDHFFLDDPVGGEHMNILKAAIITASRIVAVSGGYAWEIQTPEGGWGLHEVLTVRPRQCVSAMPTRDNQMSRVGIACLLYTSPSPRD